MRKSFVCAVEEKLSCGLDKKKNHKAPGSGHGTGFVEALSLLET